MPVFVLINTYTCEPRVEIVAVQITNTVFAFFSFFFSFFFFFLRAVSLSCGHNTDNSHVIYWMESSLWPVIICHFQERLVEFTMAQYCGKTRRKRIANRRSLWKLSQVGCAVQYPFVKVWTLLRSLLLCPLLWGHLLLWHFWGLCCVLYCVCVCVCVCMRERVRERVPIFLVRFKRASVLNQSAKQCGNRFSDSSMLKISSNTSNIPFIVFHQLLKDSKWMLFIENWAQWHLFIFSNVCKFW